MRHGVTGVRCAEHEVRSGNRSVPPRLARCRRRQLPPTRTSSSGLKTPSRIGTAWAPGHAGPLTSRPDAIDQTRATPFVAAGERAGRPVGTEGDAVDEPVMVQKPEQQPTAREGVHTREAILARRSRACSRRISTAPPDGAAAPSGPDRPKPLPVTAAPETNHATVGDGHQIARPDRRRTQSATGAPASTRPAGDLPVRLQSRACPLRPAVRMERPSPL